MALLEAKFIGSLIGKVALVTGASRGIGKGIAKMLAEAGATVYITGRKLDSPDSLTKSSLRSTADEICSKGGLCIPVVCDHGKDTDVEALFKQLSREQDGRLDILVNNAFSAVNFIMENIRQKFYEQPIEAWDLITRVGTRSNYVAAHYAANMMIPRQSGLIFNISSAGGLRYLFNIPYGVGKEANDRMAVDMAIELKKHNVLAVSLWPGPVETETIADTIQNNPNATKQQLKLFEHAEDPTFTGKAIVALASDKSYMSKTGRIHIVAELATEYGFKDVGGIQPLSFRQMKYLMRHMMPSIEWLVPRFLYLPRWVISLSGQKL